MPIQVYSTPSGICSEVFITAIPEPHRPGQTEAAEIFRAVARVLESSQSHIVHERILATEAALESVVPVRNRLYGGLDDGVPPTRLAVPVGGIGEFAGVQVHAIRGGQAPQAFRAEGSVRGRTMEFGGQQYVALSGIAADEAGGAEEQARAVFDKAVAALRQAGGDMRSVARTWVWLDDILSWYADFNRVRNGFFRECGILDGQNERNLPPASTGIGVGLAGGPKCGLDVVAVIGEGADIRHYQAAGNQRFAFDYGSAFSRAASVATPGGETVYVSGTAAIDAQGATQHVGDARAQIDATLGHVRAVLRDMQCGDEDVVQAIVYCKTPEVERVFRSMKPQLSWPHVVVLADVCRDDLLFEVEATACRGARRMQ